MTSKSHTWDFLCVIAPSMQNLCSEVAIDLPRYDGYGLRRWRPNVLYDSIQRHLWLSLRTASCWISRGLKASGDVSDPTLSPCRSLDRQLTSMQNLKPF